jgi:hypothetical protein
MSVQPIDPGARIPENPTGIRTIPALTTSIGMFIVLTHASQCSSPNHELQMPCEPLPRRSKRCSATEL